MAAVCTSMQNLVTFGQTVVEKSQFFIFKMAAATILDFENLKFQWSIRWRVPICITLPNFIRMSQTNADHWFGWFWWNLAVWCILVPFCGSTTEINDNLTAFQNGGRLLSWTCCICIWTSHKDYFRVSIFLQNLVRIDPVALIIWQFRYFVCLPWKHLFTPQN